MKPEPKRYVTKKMSKAAIARALAAGDEAERHDTTPAPPPSELLEGARRQGGEAA